MNNQRAKNLKYCFIAFYKSSTVSENGHMSVFQYPLPYVLKENLTLSMFIAENYCCFSNSVILSTAPFSDFIINFADMLPDVNETFPDGHSQ